MARRGRRAAQSGIALVLVLWVVALMVLFATAFSVSVRSETRLAFSASQRARAGVAAEAGVRRAILALMAPDTASGDADEEAQDVDVPAPSPRERQQLNFRFDGVDVVMAIIPESAFVDVNVSAAPLIKGVVEAAARRAGGRDEARVRAVADAILDWRDLDDRRRDSGAEERDYRALGRAGPRNQPFLSVAELAEVAGMDRDLFETLRPMVTVFSFSPQIDPLAADAAVLEALPEVSPEQVEGFLSARGEGVPESESVALLTGSRPFLARRATSTYTVLARAVTSQGVAAVRRAVVKVNLRAARPLSILAWFRDTKGQTLGAPERLPEADDTP